MYQIILKDFTGDQLKKSVIAELYDFNQAFRELIQLQSVELKKPRAYDRIHHIKDHRELVYFSDGSGSGFKEKESFELLNDQNLNHVIVEMPVTHILAFGSDSRKKYDYIKKILKERKGRNENINL